MGEESTIEGAKCLWAREGTRRNLSCNRPPDILCLFAPGVSRISLLNCPVTRCRNESPMLFIATPSSNLLSLSLRTAVALTATDSAWDERRARWGYPTVGRVNQQPGRFPLAHGGMRIDHTRCRISPWSTVLPRALAVAVSGTHCRLGRKKSETVGGRSAVRQVARSVHCVA